MHIDLYACFSLYDKIGVIDFCRVFKYSVIYKYYGYVSIVASNWLALDLVFFPFMPPSLNSVEGSISVLHAVCILQAMVRVKNTTLSFHTRAMVALVGGPGNQHVPLGKAPRGVAKAKVRLLAGFTGRQIASLEVPLQISGEELRMFLHDLLPGNCDKLIYGNSILKDSEVLSFEARSEVHIYAICKARRAALSDLFPVFFHGFLDYEDEREGAVGFRRPFWRLGLLLDLFDVPPIHSASERLRFDVRDYLFSEQEYWDALWQQQIGFPQEQEQELVSLFLHGCRQCPMHMFPVPSAMKLHAMKAPAMKRMPMAWNDGRRGNRVRTSGKRM